MSEERTYGYDAGYKEGFRTARKTAEQMCVYSSGEELVTGHAVCSSCMRAIDPWDHFCRHCGAMITNRWKPEEDA